MDKNKLINNNREMLTRSWMTLREVNTDKSLKLEKPEVFKEIDSNILVGLTNEFPNIEEVSLTKAINDRRSLRKYSEQLLTFEEVSYLLWETARVDSNKGNIVFRTIPTGGATNGMETYIYINRVEGIDSGLYHYIQNKHTLEFMGNENDLTDKVNEAMLHQLRNANVVVFLSAVPYRSEYKYAHMAHKMLLIEAGHAAQNLSLACEAIQSGAVCIAAYNQELSDQVLQLDGDNEFTTYIIAVGKKG